MIKRPESKTETTQNLHCLETGSASISSGRKLPPPGSLLAAPGGRSTIAVRGRHVAPVLSSSRSEFIA